MIPEIDTIEIGDCLVYDTDSVNDYVGKLKSTIADLKRQVATLKHKRPSGKFIISRSDGFYLGSFNSDNHSISYNWTARPKTDLHPVDYATAERIVATLFSFQETDEYGRHHAYTIERVETPKDKL